MTTRNRKVGRRMMSIFRAFAFIGVVASALSWSTASYAQASNAPTFQQVVDGAKKEGELTVVFLVPGKAPNRQMIADAFNKRFGLNVKITWANVHPYTLLQQLNAEGTAGHFSFDVAESNAYDLSTVYENGWIKPYPYAAVFGKELPSMETAVKKDSSGELLGTMLTYRDNVYGTIWNKNQVTDADSVHVYLDLTNPKWKGRLAVDSPDLEPLAQFVTIMGPDKVIEMAKQVLANQPLLKSSSGQIVAAVSSGEALVGTGNSAAATAAQGRGEPIGYRVFEDYVFAEPVAIYTPTVPPHPNAARLFSAWLVTEGMYLIKDELAGTIDDRRSYMGETLGATIRPGAKIVGAKTIAEFHQVHDVLKTIEQMTTGMQPAKQ